MTWKPDRPYRPEVQKCRNRLIRYCTGMGLDIGCGAEKIKPSAIGVDLHGADVNTDLSRGLLIFRDNMFDFVFSSHCLEDFNCPGDILADWWRLVRPGGHLVLYLPHRLHYPNQGQPGANPAHRNDFIPGDIVRLMDQKGANYEIVHHETRDQNDEYSFEIVFKKLTSANMPKADLGHPKTFGKKRALVIRYGAFGDMIVATAVLPYLKQDGYEVTFNTTSRGLAVLANNPHVDHFWLQEQDVIDPRQLREYWEEISEGFDKVVNLTHSIENKWLFTPDTNEYNLSLMERRAIAGDVNYYRYACEVAGYPDAENPRGELYPSDIEKGLLQLFRRKYRDKFVILWALSGSAMHKAYPYGEQVALSILQAYEDIITVTVGDRFCRILEWDHPQAVKKSDIWDMRTALLAAGIVDLVISPETALLNAAGCYDTPKIGFLTHSSRKNLCDTWTNDFSMQAAIACSPCHRMIYANTVKNDCPQLADDIPFAACAGAFDPLKVIKKIEEIYHAYHVKRGTAPQVRSNLIVLPGGRRKRAALHRPTGLSL